MSRPTAKTETFRIYFRLLGYVRPYLSTFAISLVGFALFAAAQPLFAVALKYFVDGLSDTSIVPFPAVPVLSTLDLLYSVPIFIILVAILQGLGSYLGNVFIAKVAYGLIRDLRCKLFNKLLTLPNRFFDHHNSGHLVSRIVFNVSLVSGAATDAIKVLFREGLSIVALFGYLLWINWKLTMVMVAILPVIGWMVHRANHRFRRQSRKIQESIGDVTHITTESIQGYRVVRSFGGDEYEKKRFFAAADMSMQRQLRMVKITDTFTPLLQVVTYSGMAALLYLVTALRGDSSVGDLVAYVTAAGLLPKPIRQLSEISATIQKSLAAADSIFSLLDEESEKDAGQIKLEKCKGEIRARSLSFSYSSDSPIILHGIDFHAQPGQMIALVGQSGSGKSTLVNLLPRFYQGWSGDLMIDGIPIQDITLNSLRCHISLVTQQVTLFNDTVANNIAYGALAGTSRQKVIKAAEAAYARDFIQTLPNGFDTLIGENGVLLSGGQRQRIAIARALLKDSPILILDEATSALDTESERHIQLALENLTRHRTTIVIAHRLSTIERADQILVMDGGRIVERGTHAQLLQAGGAYAKLQRLQHEKGL